MRALIFPWLSRLSELGRFLPRRFRPEPRVPHAGGGERWRLLLTPAPPAAE